MTDTLRDKLIQKGWVTPFNADTLVRLIEEHYADEPAVPPLYARQTGIGQWEGADHPSGPWRKVLPADLARWGNPVPAPPADGEVARFRALCAELLSALEREGYAHWVNGPDEDDLCLRARAALAEADEPAAPDGRDPAAVTGQPSDGEIMGLMPQQMHEDLAAAVRAMAAQEGIDSATAKGVIRIMLNRHVVDLARAVLARWGNPEPAPPADGEVAEFARLLEAGGNCPTGTKLTRDHCRRVAALLHRLQELAPAPPADGEVAELVAALRRRAAQNSLGIADPIMRRAAELLQRQALVPVAVSERPWEREGWCDAEGRCWWGRGESDDWSADWTLATPEAVAEFCEFSPRTVCLPAHALPLPEVSNG